MRIGALILGILGGLQGLGLAMIGGAIFALNGAQGAVALMFLIPLASIIGGSLAIAAPPVAAALMGLSAVAWLWIGAQFGYAVNFFTFLPVVLSGVGAVLAVCSLSQEGAGAPRLLENFLTLSNEPISAPSPAAPTALAPATSLNVESQPLKTASSYSYDRARWNALVRHDDTLAMVVEKLQPLGPQWIDYVASEYLLIGDKAYLPKIVESALKQARAEFERKENERKENERREHEEKSAVQPKQNAILTTSNSKPDLKLYVIAGGTALAMMAAVGLVYFVFKSKESQPVPLNIQYAFELKQKAPGALVSLHTILTQKYSNVDWIWNLAGVSSPLQHVLFDGRSYVGGNVCKPHDCADNQMTFLISMDGLRAVALLHIADEGADTVFGFPTTSEFNFLQSAK